MLRPLSPRFTYGPAPSRRRPPIAWNARGVALGRPVVVDIVKRERAGIGISIGEPRGQHPGRIRRAGFLVVQATSEPEAAMRRVRAGIARAAVVEPISYRVHGVRWVVADFQRGFASVAAIGCHVVQLGGANTYDQNDIVDCLSRRRDTLTPPRRPAGEATDANGAVDSGRTAVCARGSQSAH